MVQITGMNDLKTKLRLVQGITMGITTLGAASMLSDMSVATGMPFSPFSLTTTVFGIGGSLVCELMVRRLS
jgi:hypothetical protein